MSKLKPSKKIKLISLVITVICGFAAIAVFTFLTVRASPDFKSDAFTDETYIGKGTSRVEIATTTGQVTIAKCYSPNPNWYWSTTTTVRDISVINNANATTTKTIYCDDYNCILWTDEAAAPGTVCIATDSNVYANLLWSKTDAGAPTTYTWADSYFSISGGDIGGTHSADLRAGTGNTLIGARNWLERYYTSAAGTFDAMDACKAKGSGWRLPNILELDSIRDQAKGSAPYSRLPGIQSGYYWSSTEYASDGAWPLHFSDGSVSGSGKTTDNYVRCVRGQ